MKADIRSGEAQRSGRVHALLWAGIAALLLLPLVAMRFTDAVAWTRFDFAAAAILLVGAGLLFELGVRVLHRPMHRLVAGSALVLGVMLIWAEGAVGVF